MSRSRAIFWVCAGLAMAAGAGEPLRIPASLTPQEYRADLQVWSWNIAAASLEKLIPPFQQKYPHVNVRIDMNATNLESRFLLSLAAQVGAPDLSQLQVREAPRYAVTGKLTDITECAQKYEKAFAPSFWDSCVHEGRIYALPWDMGPCAVFYKRGIFQQYGLDPERIETWDDYIALGKELVAKSNGQTKMLCIPTGNMADLFEIFLQQSGGQLFDAEGRIALYSPETLETLNLLKKLLEANISGNIVSFSFEFFASFKTDTIATYPMASWFGGLIRDYAPDTAGNWGVFRLPAYHPGGLRTSNLGGSVLVMPDQCAQKEAAWAYMEYALCTPEAQLAQYRDFDLFPALLSTHQDPFFDEPVPFFGNQHVRRLFSLDIEKISVMHRTTDWMEAMRYVQQALSKWATAIQEPPEQLMQSLEDKLSRRLNRPAAPHSPRVAMGVIP